MSRTIDRRELRQCHSAATPAQASFQENKNASAGLGITSHPYRVTCFSHVLQER